MERVDIGMLTNLLSDDGTSYDIFCYVFSTFLYICRQIRWVRGVVNGLRNILYCFHSSHCNSLLFLIMQLHKCFVVRNYVYRQSEGSRIWRLKSIQSEYNSFQVPTSFHTEEQFQMGWKRKISRHGDCLVRH